MQKSPMNTMQQAELQGKLTKVLADFRLVHGTSSLSIFYFLVSYAWGYVRREGETNEAIKRQMMLRCDDCEQAYARVTNAMSQPRLPGMGRS